MRGHTVLSCGRLVRVDQRATIPHWIKSQISNESGTQETEGNGPLMGRSPLFLEA